jgi:hypothetical protein
MKRVLPRTFQSSRIFAAGWNAARAHYLKKDSGKINPYPPGPEHARWNEGFARALGR